MDSVLDGEMEMVFVHIRTRTTLVSPSTRHTVTTRAESDAVKFAKKFLAEFRRQSTGVKNQTGVSRLCMISIPVSAIVEKLAWRRGRQQMKDAERTTRLPLESKRRRNSDNAQMSSDK
jgi:hypothetical protein